MRTTGWEYGFANAQEKSDTAYMLLLKARKHLRTKQRPRIVTSLLPVSGVRTMTAKNHFNEIKKRETAGINNHMETISKAVKS